MIEAPSIIERLREIESGYRASKGVYHAAKIFSEDEIEEVFESLPFIIKALDECWTTLPSCGSLFGDGRDAQDALRALGYSWGDDE